MMNTPGDGDRTGLFSWKSGILIAAVFLTGCQELGLRSPLSQGDQIEARYTLKTIFAPTPQDVAYLATLGKEADKQLTNCQQTQDCEGAHFVRALSLLQENRDLALHHFQKVAVSPNDGPLSRSSRVWLWILDETSPTNSFSKSRTNLAQGLIQALLTKDLALARQPFSRPSSGPETRALQSQIGYDAKIKTLSEQVQSLAHDVAEFRNQSSALQSLRNELDVRDKRVKELTLQLDALRRIDQELKEKSTPTRLSDTITPAKDERASSP